MKIKKKFFKCCINDDGSKVTVTGPSLALFQAKPTNRSVLLEE